MKNIFEEINNNQYKALLSFEKINFTEKRAKEMFEYSNSSSFYKYLETSPHQNLKESQDYLKTLVERDEKGYLNGDSKYWFVIEKIENKMIGTVGFVDIDKEKKSACIAIGLSESYRHEGRGIEAILSLLYFGFNHLNFYRIWLITHHKNKPVIELHKHMGFSISGELRDFYNVNNNFENAMYLSCLKKQFDYDRSLGILKFLKKKSI